MVAASIFKARKVASLSSLRGVSPKAEKQLSSAATARDVVFLVMGVGKFDRSLFGHAQDVDQNRRTLSPAHRR
jgi:hypothetical protein